MVHELIAESIVVSFGDRSILTDVSLNCKTGDIVGLFGRNGCGKSTLLKVVFGTQEATSKFLSIDGVKIEQPFASKNKISFLPQDRFIPKYLTVKRTISLFLNDRDSRCLLTDKYIAPILENKITELSFGQLRYFETRLILALPTFFSLLDEPFKGLSPIMIDEIKKLIIVTSTFKGLVLVDHNSNEVLDITTKNYLLNQGCLTLLKES